MSERRVSRRGPATTLRVVGGVIAIAAPFALGLIGHSPWKALLLVPAFALSYALSRGGRSTERSRDGASAGTTIGATVGTGLAIGLVHLVLTGVLYLVGLGLGELFSEVLPVDPLSAPDLVFVAIVWAVTLACAATSRHLEGRRAPPDPPT